MHELKQSWFVRLQTFHRKLGSGVYPVAQVSQSGHAHSVQRLAIRIEHLPFQRAAADQSHVAGSRLFVGFGRDLGEGVTIYRDRKIGLSAEKFTLLVLV